MAGTLSQTVASPVPPARRPGLFSPGWLEVFPGRRRSSRRDTGQEQRPAKTGTAGSWS